MNSIALAVVNDHASYLRGMKMILTYMENPNCSLQMLNRGIFNLCNSYYRFSKACAGDRELGRSTTYIQEATHQVIEYWVNHWEENQGD